MREMCGVCITGPRYNVAGRGYNSQRCGSLTREVQIPEKKRDVVLLLEILGYCVVPLACFLFSGLF